MAHYLSQSRIEDPVWLEPNDITLLQTRLSEAEILLRSGIECQMDFSTGQIISELVGQKDVKFVDLACLRNVLAPVRRVPLEILSEIFMLSCITEHFTEDYRWQYNLVPRTFTITHVCVAWRKAAHSNPRLWSRLSICLEDQLLSSDFVWVHDWITRSGALPLELYLDFCIERNIEDSKAYKKRGKQFLEYTLAHFGHKIRLLDIFGLPSSFIPLLHLPPSSLRSLEKVFFSTSEDGDDTIDSSTFPRQVEIFLDAPKLQHVQIDNTLFLDLFALPAEQLILLKVNTVDVESHPVINMDILGLLLKCRQMVTLEISLVSSQVSNGGNTIFLLPSLKSLTTTWCSADNILRHITAPLLEELSLTYRGEDLNDLATMDVTDFRRRSAPTLLSLTLTQLRRGSYRRDQESSDKIVTILSHFSTIRFLEIHFLYDVDPLIRAMTLTENHHLLPNLEHLILEAENMDNVSAAGLKSMVLSRWRPAQADGGMIHNKSSHLQKVAIRHFHISADSEEHLTQMAGLSGLVFDYTPGRRTMIRKSYYR